MENDKKQQQDQYADLVVPTHDENGEELSKKARNKIRKQMIAERKKAEKKAAQAAKEAANPKPKKAKKEEILDPGKYFENRSEIVTKLKEDPKSDYFPYPHKFETTHTVIAFREAFDATLTEKGVFAEDQEVAVAGRVTSVRSASSNLFFYDITANGASMQVMANRKAYGNDEDFEKATDLIKRGDIVGIRGAPGRTKPGELSIKATKLKLLSPCLHMMPASRTGITDPEIRFRKRYLDLLVNTEKRDKDGNIVRSDVRQKFITRSKVIRFLRQYMDKMGFIEVETPTLNMLAGGATAKPFVTHYNALDRDVFMRVAPELFLKTLVIGGMDRVFEIGKNFRNEGMDQTHNPEFTSMEFYMAYADYNDLMDITEDMLSELVLSLNNNNPVVTINDEEGKEVKVDFTRPWRRVNMMEELQTYLEGEAPQDLESDEARAYFDKEAKRLNVDCATPRTTARLIDKLVGHFIEDTFVNPTFLVEHPQLMCPLAKYHRSKPGLTERFELFINKHEFANAYTELNDPFVQRKLFEGQMKNKAEGDDEAQPIDEGFIEAMQHALPPTAGWGLGVDRLTMLLTNSNTIQEVILFPAMKPKDNEPAAKED